jgi:hypothetical protein
MKAREVFTRMMSVLGAVVGYGCLALFLWLVSTQIYRWFRDGEWPHVGLIEGLRTAAISCCAKNGAEGKVAGFLSWLDSPVDWLGLHRVFEAIPASLALFAVSIVGNCLFIYFRDRTPPRGNPAARERHRPA